jgi:GAF domain-containing protein
MQSAPLRPDETASLQALDSLEVLDSGAEGEFDALVDVASHVCGAPISLITLIDANRQWFKANVGLPGVAETAREVAFCAHTVLGTDLFEVPDASMDERFHDNPLVTGPPDIRFYAGAPIVLSSGHRVGTL